MAAKRNTRTEPAGSVAEQMIELLGQIDLPTTVHSFGDRPHVTETGSEWGQPDWSSARQQIQRG